jgi:hypothetical protein
VKTVLERVRGEFAVADSVRACAEKPSFAASAFLRCGEFHPRSKPNGFPALDEADATAMVPATLTERRVALSAELRGISLSPSDANPRDDANNPSGANPRGDANNPSGANPSRRNGPNGTNRRPGRRRL